MMSNQYYLQQQQHHQRYYASPLQHPSTSSSSSSSSRAAAAAAAAAAPPVTEPSFTPSMRDRQARGKDPYQASEKGPYPFEDSPSTSDMEFDEVDSPSRAAAAGRLGHLVGDSFEERRQKAFAIEVLDDPEKLAMYACSRGDVSRSVS